jgi:hypothetical protein
MMVKTTTELRGMLHGTAIITALTREMVEDKIFHEMLADKFVITN